MPSPAHLVADSHGFGMIPGIASPNQSAWNDPGPLPYAPPAPPPVGSTCVNMGEFGWRNSITRLPCTPGNPPAPTSPPQLRIQSLMTFYPGAMPPGTYPTTTDGATNPTLGGATPPPSPSISPLGLPAPTPPPTYYASSPSPASSGSGPGSGISPWLLAGGAILALLYFGNQKKRKRR